MAYIGPWMKIIKVYFDFIDFCENDVDKENYEVKTYGHFT